MVSSKTWFITGCSSGFGYELAQILLEAGHRVVVTARNIETVRPFERRFAERALCLALDVTSSEQITAAVTQAIRHFGGIDVLVNNAGYGLIGAVEESTDAEARALFDTNFFGLLDVTRALLPHFREKKRGHIINLSSVAGLVGSAGFGLYNASKFAIEGLSEALSLELKPLGIAVTLVEPGPFRTAFLGRSLSRSSEIADYAAISGAMRDYARDNDGHQKGDPRKAAQAILTISEMATPPLRLPLGQWTLDRAAFKIESLQKSLQDWSQVARESDFNA